MARFSSASRNALATCHPELQRLFNRVVEITDCKVIEGHRGKELQEIAFAAGRSKVHWPNSKHNTSPSVAVDVAPYPIDWKNRERFCFLAGIVEAVAAEMGINIRWGGDFNEDGLNAGDRDNWDMPHYELVEG
jgi:peptidoglycan LD-endopeptidase CwlK